LATLNLSDLGSILSGPDPWFRTGNPVWFQGLSLSAAPIRAHQLHEPRKGESSDRALADSAVNTLTSEDAHHRVQVTQTWRDGTGLEKARTLGNHVCPRSSQVKTDPAGPECRAPLLHPLWRGKNTLLERRRSVTFRQPQTGVLKSEH